MSGTTVVLALVLGFGAGALSGLFGVGGGILFVPTLALVVGLGQLDAQATSLAAMIPVVVFGACPGPSDAKIPHDRHHGPERGEHGGAFADPSGRRRLEGIEGAIQPVDQVGRHAVDPFELRGGQRRRPSGITANCIEVIHQGPDFALDVAGRPFEAAGQPAGGHDERHLGEGRDERRHGNDTQEDDGPVVHACSRARAC